MPSAASTIYIVVEMDQIYKYIQTHSTFLQACNFCVQYLEKKKNSCDPIQYTITVH